MNLGPDMTVLFVCFRALGRARRTGERKRRSGQWKENAGKDAAGDEIAEFCFKVLRFICRLKRVATSLQSCETRAQKQTETERNRKKATDAAGQKAAPGLDAESNLLERGVVGGTKASHRVPALGSSEAMNTRA